MKTVVHAACPHDCPDACGVLITTENGRAIKIQGDSAHPVTRGFLCAKVAKYLDRVYSPDRVLYPMRRLIPKGSPSQNVQQSQTWQRISWDEALTEISQRFKVISRDFGSEAILPYSYGGTLGALNGASMDRRFFHRLGASCLERSICSAAGEAGILSVQGVKLGTEPEQFRHSKYIIAWGANIHWNNVHLWPFIEEARRNGAKLVVIDPYQTRTAKCADWYLPINPGTDVALALGLMQVIIAESLQDADYISRYTIGFDELKHKVADYTPQAVSHWTGLAVEDIVRLAREYATVRPAAIRVNYGVQRSENGGMAVRAITMLPCLTGSWKEVGGGLQLSTSGAFGLNRAALERADLMSLSLGRNARTLNMVELGRVLNEVDDPPVKALFVYNSNPAAVCPNHNEVIRGLKRPDLFTVVHEQFFTDTVDYADIVLPATTFFEHEDLQAAYGHYFIQKSNQAIAPLGEARSNVDLFRGLAEAMGFDDDCFKDSADDLIDQALDSKNPWLNGIDRERLEREKHIRLNFGNTDGAFLPFARGGFRTASGKAEFYSPGLRSHGLDPVIEFTPPLESRAGSGRELYPLELLARKADNFLNSTFCNISSVQEMEQTDLLEIHSVDARARSIQDGDQVRVFNGRGSIALIARVNDAVQPGVVAARLNWARLRNEKININVLTSEKLTDMGNSATFYSVLVEVEPIHAVRTAPGGRADLDATPCSTV
ncbi:MAG TPA: molybdopterin-dependent oxidoreductase [Terriglobales bacterium]|jgi:anaerobic selenocysteine-containing dehydrogenase|nr:molybdopterin-dependent oxidoreductase [Terriglobales bacterium]